MLTPQEVAEHGFSKSRMGGYNMKEVDDFLDELTADFSELYKENSVLKGKIKKVAVATYIITPYNVDIIGDLIDELENNGMYF